MQELEQCLKLRAGALRYHLNCTISEIAHPPGHAAGRRLADGGSPEVDTLHAPVHDGMKVHMAVAWRGGGHSCSPPTDQVLRSPPGRAIGLWRDKQQRQPNADKPHDQPDSERPLALRRAGCLVQQVIMPLSFKLCQ